jgi:CBS domain-containing protein/sporulation protein YlmC with PRC-barrel domain
MNGNGNKTANHAKLERVFRLSDIIGRKVLLDGKKVGKLADIIILETEKIPEVTHFWIRRPFGYKSLLVPLEKIKEIKDSEIIIEAASIEHYENEPGTSQILLRDHILDKKVLDLDDNEVEVVYDVKLVQRNGKLYVSEVDFSKYGLLRRLGLKWVAKFIYGLAEKIKKETLSWTYVQPLPEHLGSFSGNVKLKVLKEKLPEIHPVDLADILEELDHGQRLAIFNELDTQHASDTLEEIEPRVQRDLISSIRKERAAELINDMTPAQAADILAILPAAETDEIIALMDKDNAQKIQFILDKHEEKISNFSTSYFIKLPAKTRVSQVLLQYRDIARDKDEIMYLYIVAEEDKLLGVVDLKEVLQANLDETLEDIMTTNVISLHPDNTLLEAAEMFSRYSFRAIPIVDDNNVISGVILYRDIINLKHRFV